MPRELVRYQDAGHFHFVTFSCFGRKPYLRTAFGRDLFERSLEAMRVRYGFVVVGYVVMPEHVHLLVSEPRVAVLGKAIQALKLSVAVQSVQSVQRPFWWRGTTTSMCLVRGSGKEKVEYMHQNPVARGLVPDAGDWPWSSYRHYQTGERGVVEIESEWTAGKRERVGGE